MRFTKNYFKSPKIHSFTTAKLQINQFDYFDSSNVSDVHEISNLHTSKFNI